MNLSIFTLKVTVKTIWTLIKHRTKVCFLNILNFVSSRNEHFAILVMTIMLRASGPKRYEFVLILLRIHKANKLLQY